MIGQGVLSASKMLLAAAREEVRVTEKLEVKETCAPPTILFVLGPMTNLGEPCGLPQLAGALGRVFQALLHLDPVVGVDELSQDDGVFERRIKCLVAPAALVVDILTDDPPLLLVKCNAA